jgi:hypothetical protein
MACNVFSPAEIAIALISNHIMMTERKQGQSLSIKIVWMLNAFSIA